MGRPKSTDPRNCILKVRLTEDEMDKLKLVKSITGFSESDLVRKALNRSLDIIVMIQQAEKKVKYFMEECKNA